uniref:Protoporphyrinogen oxidase n=1 Tax=Aceria tosichella TaxID=561515 RepID=A0A6G1SG59_9ACAR
MSMINATRGKRLVVIGGGLSGLSYAHYLRNFLQFHKKNGAVSKITILEANDYMGGSVKSRVFDDGVIHELGPRSVRLAGVRSKNTATLLDQLGLSDRVLSITPKSAAGSDRYVYRNDKFWKVPTVLWKPFSKLPGSKATLIGTLMNDLFKKEKFNTEGLPDNDPSIYEFIAFRFGQEAAESVLDPLLRGITAGDARKLSTKAIFSDIFEKEQTYGSIVKGVFKPPVTKMPHDDLFPHDVLESKLLDKFEKERALSYNLTTGLQTLPEHLSNSLLNSNDDDVIAIYNRTKVLSVNFDNDELESGAPCSVSVETIDGDRVVIEADHIVSCIPANQFVQTFPESMPAEQKEALKFLYEIPHRPVGCVTVEYRDLSKSLPNMSSSFGFLTHSKAGCQVLGISFDSAMFPAIDKPTGSFRMTCMMGGEWYKEIFGTDNLDKVTDAQLEQISLDEIQRLLGIKDEPFRMSPYLWKTGIAQYRPGHVGRVRDTRKNIETLKLPLTILGQSYDGIAINDVIFSARMAADSFVKTL